MDFEKIKKIFKNDDGKNKNTGTLIILILIGVLLIIGSNFFKNQTTENTSAVQQSNANNQSNTDDSTKVYEEQLQNQLKKTLENIQGVGKVDVMIYFGSGEEEVPAVNVNDSTNTIEENDNSGGKRNTTEKNNSSTVVITNNGDKNEPLILKTYKPQITGVCIVAEGAGDKYIKLQLTEAVINLFNVPVDKVNVYAMKK